eukprot:CAMPEP_0182418374 /NCGR_PEP_ID=MMETSP1167-20130531/2827_1 /TAXON_ID=2988 /ORGANISM="Mallomonas Sp, Strain CCMP3275" /LENGTH=184 /DNA_ID=CAMNT_0024592559 /DNA_START=123 /DNA_END=677 /DNA_ORIENTATION=+
MSQVDTTDKKGLIMLIIGAQAVLSFPFTICAFVVSGTANAGFNVVLTALLLNAFIGGSYYVVRKSKTPIAVGFLIGCAIMMTLLSLMTAVYWGQLANCQMVDRDVKQYSCEQVGGYSAVAAFASLLFIVQIAFTGAIIKYRAELIDEVGLYDEISGASAGAPNPLLRDSSPYEPSKYAQPSADL